MNCESQLLLLVDRFAYLLAGGCVGLLVEHRWHLTDRLFGWLEARTWTNCGPE